MEIFPENFLSALGAIVAIDLVLAGDNAIVIALAARGLPSGLRKRAMVWGGLGAVGVRALMTLGVVWLLQIPGLLMAGGAMLLWIAVKLLADQDGAGPNADGGRASFWGAMKTIVVADAVMGLDNVLAVGGAAQGSYLLVILGLLLSVPMVVWGSGAVLTLTRRFPLLVDAGAAALAGTAVKMALGEPLLAAWTGALEGMHWAVHAVAIAAVLVLGRGLRSRTRAPAA
jgi:YjbE family integral membrane protein